MNVYKICKKNAEMSIKMSNFGLFLAFLKKLEPFFKKPLFLCL
jgi:hypothetical protein